MKLFTHLVFLSIAIAAPSVRADMIAAGETVIISRAIQDITFTPGTDFNPTGEDFTIAGVFGDGLLRLNREAQDGTTISIPSLTGVYTGFHPLLGSYRFGTLSPAGEAAFSGTISNVTLDPSDPGFASGDPSSFASGDYQVSGDFFEFELLDTPIPILFTTGPTVFNSQFDGLPPSVGTVIDAGIDPVEILLNGQVIGFSTNRRIIATVPEPSSLFLLGGLAFVPLLHRRRTP
jgi:hypothetical protein